MNCPDKCEKCGTPIEPEFHYCPQCGCRLAFYDFRAMVDAAFSQVDEVNTASMALRMDDLARKIQMLEEDLEVFLSGKV